MMDLKWLTENWYKSTDDDGNYVIRFRNPTYGSYIGTIQDLDVVDHIVWIHNSLVQNQHDCHSAEGTHMIRNGIPVHQDENGNFYPCVIFMFGSTKEALVEMMKR